MARAATPLRPGEGRGDQRPQVQVPQADAGVHDAGDAGVGGAPRTSWRRGVWYVCGGTGAVTLLYLGYLRRQTRIEERVRRRRVQRAARSRLGVENTEDRDLDLVPSRLRRPGAVVLEIDDEDPVFEHLDYAPSAHGYDLPRAAGQ